MEPHAHDWRDVHAVRHAGSGPTGAFTYQRCWCGAYRLPRVGGPLATHYRNLSRGGIPYEPRVDGDYLVYAETTDTERSAP